MNTETKPTVRTGALALIGICVGAILLAWVAIEAMIELSGRVSDAVHYFLVVPIACGLASFSLLLAAFIALPRMFRRLSEPVNGLTPVKFDRRQTLSFYRVMLGSIAIVTVNKLVEHSWTLPNSELSAPVFFLAILGGGTCARLVVIKFGLSPEKRPERHW